MENDNVLIFNPSMSVLQHLEFQFKTLLQNSVVKYAKCCRKGCINISLSVKNVWGIKVGQFLRSEWAILFMVSLVSYLIEDRPFIFSFLFYFNFSFVFDVNVIIFNFFSFYYFQGLNSLKMEDDCGNNFFFRFSSVEIVQQYL